jgi:hypothetical protein
MYRTGVVLDAPGVATAFQVTGHSADSWHAVWSPGPRFSVGIRFRTPAAADELLGLSHGGVYRFGTASE